MPWHKHVHETATLASQMAAAGQTTDICYKQLYWDILPSFFRPPFMLCPNLIPVPGETLSMGPEGIFCTVLYEHKQAIFFVEVFPKESLLVEGERERADTRMRERFRQLENAGLACETMVGMCAFGDCVVYYTYEHGAEIRPQREGTPPVEWWQSIVEGQGFEKFVENVVEPLNEVVGKLVGERRDEVL